MQDLAVCARATIAVVTAALMVGAAPAQAQDAGQFYKGKTVTITVGFSAGGGYDQYARVLGRHFGKHVPGSPNVLIQNMPGAASLKAVQHLDQVAAADGTTIVTFNSGLITQSLTAPAQMPVDFRRFGWIGNVSEDIRVCFTWHTLGVKSWSEFVARDKAVFGNTGVGTSAYIDSRVLIHLMGVKLQTVQGYPGSNDKKLAIERGELDGDCGSYTSLPDEWLKDKKINLLVRFSKTVPADMSPAVPYAGDLIADAEKRQTFELLLAGAVIGRPFIVNKAVPADRIAALRAAFDATMIDPEFLSEAAKQRLIVGPESGAAVEKRIDAIYRTPAEAVARAKAISE
jgi:tripartite-type tricarboxylate transporter receptor subunit TctC